MSSRPELEMLNKPFPITDTQIRFFQQNGFVKIKNVLPADTIRYMNEIISAEVKRLNTQHLPIEHHHTYERVHTMKSER